MAGFTKQILQILHSQNLMDQAVLDGQKAMKRLTLKLVFSRKYETDLAREHEYRFCLGDKEMSHNRIGLEEDLHFAETTGPGRHHSAGRPGGHQGNRQPEAGTLPQA